MNDQETLVSLYKLRTDHRDNVLPYFRSIADPSMLALEIPSRYAPYHKGENVAWRMRESI
jgi:hypothetical protein